ncbi:MAG: hypothetical protein GYA50_08600, partial [Eubacteriaceae bacterium]|nr:hypothetical protein [Eubacteriaceae bacterium]
MAAIPEFNFTYDENPYIKSALQYQLDAVDAAQQQYKYQADRSLAKAQQTQMQTNKAATANYFNTINPYGAGADSLASAGLSHSGIAQSNMARGYSTYQGSLGQSAADYANTQADINTAMLGYAAQANADKQNAYANYQSNLANDYNQSRSYNYGVWQDAQDRDYQRQRDQILD